MRIVLFVLSALLSTNMMAATIVPFSLQLDAAYFAGSNQLFSEMFDTNGATIDSIQYKVAGGVVAPVYGSTFLSIDAVVPMRR